uniref:Uncharacterized protein n=1 Tax=Romanomermis culicivorax TaxID=13658 RepID=A0A915I3W7_ROMCU
MRLGGGEQRCPRPWIPLVNRSLCNSNFVNDPTTKVEFGNNCRNQEKSERYSKEYCFSDENPDVAALIVVLSSVRTLRKFSLVANQAAGTVFERKRMIIVWNGQLFRRFTGTPKPEIEHFHVNEKESRHDKVLRSATTGCSADVTGQFPFDGGDSSSDFTTRDGAENFKKQININDECNGNGGLASDCRLFLIITAYSTDLSAESRILKDDEWRFDNSDKPGSTFNDSSSKVLKIVNTNIILCGHEK